MLAEKSISGMISALDDVQPLSTMKTISFCEEISNGAAVARKLKRVGESQVVSLCKISSLSILSTGVAIVIEHL